MPALPVWREPVRGGHPDRELLERSGLERLRVQLNGGGFPTPPLFHLTGVHMVEVGLGSAAFEMPLTGWLRSPQGAISVGPLAIPADAALALAVLSTLPPGAQLTTSELSLRVLAPARAGGRVIARGSLLHARRTIALSEATLTDEHGQLLAHGTSLVFITLSDDAPPPASPSSEGPASEPTPPPPIQYDTPDPGSASRRAR